jgi:hypothetical protein
MATVTPNFNWPVPTSTDLVKDGATAIEALGDSIDGSLVDLKGGTTGQVLSKTSGTDMDFTWVTTDDANAIQNSIVDAKGDLISATANDTPARLAVGNNGETLVADSSTSTGLRYQVSSQPNYLINSNFDIWQRGTSFASTSGYMADRWSNVGSFNAITASQQTSGAPNGSRYYMRFTSTGSASYMNLAQMMETSTAAELWGKTVTVSVLLRRNATLNATVYFGLEKSATVDAGAGASWTAITSTNVPLASIPTGTTSADWFRATITATVPNDGTANSLRFHCYYNGGVANGSVLEFAQPMLEQGSVATNFKIASGTIQGELSACQRYYWRNTAGESLAAMSGAMGGSNTTEVDLAVVYPVQMRVRPTSLDYSTLATYDGVTTYTGGTYAIVGGRSGTLFASIRYTHTSAGLTAYRPYQIIANSSTTAYIGLSAEL